MRKKTLSFLSLEALFRSPLQLSARSRGSDVTQGSTGGGVDLVPPPVASPVSPVSPVLVAGSVVLPTVTVGPPRLLERKMKLMSNVSANNDQIQHKQCV